MKPQRSFDGVGIPADRPPLTLAFLILPGFPMGCLTSAIEPLRAANQISGVAAYRWQVVTEDSAPVASSADMQFQADVSLADMALPDALYVISSPQSALADSRRTLGALRRFARRGVTMGAFSGGVFPLARAGLLDGYRASVHWCYEAAFRTAFPKVLPCDAVLSVDRRRQTASGANAVFDLMLRRIEAELDAAIMTEVACWFQHPMVRSESVSQRRPTIASESTSDMLPEPVARAIAMFAENIADPLQISDVAAMIAVSERQLERAFKRATGLSPLIYYRHMRLQEARQMVRYSNDRMRDIADAVGYSSPWRMARHYREVFGVTPGQDRDGVELFRVRAPVPA